MKPVSCSPLVAALAAAMLALPATAAERIALVIGADTYQHATPLNNAVSDARLVTSVLEETGFEVIHLENPGVDTFYDGLEKLKRSSGLAQVGIVYFAGHGVEVDGENYLLPIDAELERLVQLRSQAVSLDDILEDLAAARLPAKVIILDCCRDNPLRRSWMTSRSVGRGLAPILDVDMPEASLVVYSSAPGQVALDGSGDNSPFTKALATQLRKPGQNLLQAFLRTSDDVVDATGGRQEPWVKMDAAGRTMRQLVLVPEGSTPVPTGGSPATVAAAPATPPAPAPQPTTATDPVGNGTAPATTAANDTSGSTMKETPAVATAPVEPAPTVGNTPEPAPATEPEPEPVPLVLPSRGYFTNEEVFHNGPYSGYNSYSRNKILRQAQEKMAGTGKADGAMGPNTQQAIRDYQLGNALPETGRLDEATLKALGLVGLPEESYTPPQKTYTPKKTYTSSNSSSSGSSNSSGSRSASSNSNNNSSSQQQSEQRTGPQMPFPGGMSPPGFPPMPQMKQNNNQQKNSNSSGSQQKDSGGRMSHARKKFMRPG